MEHWWVGALRLLVLGLMMGMVPTPVEAAFPSAAPTSTAEGEVLVVTVQVVGPVVNLWVGPSPAHAVQGQAGQVAPLPVGVDVGEVGGVQQRRVSIRPWSFPTVSA